MNSNIVSSIDNDRDFHGREGHSSNHHSNSHDITDTSKSDFAKSKNSSSIKVIALQQHNHTHTRTKYDINNTSNNTSNTYNDASQLDDNKHVVVLEHDTLEPITICIGYIFATKKMNTMSMVMAEASKVKLGLVLPNYRHLDHYNSAVNCPSTSTSTATTIRNMHYVDDDNQHGNNHTTQYATLTQERLQSHNNEESTVYDATSKRSTTAVVEQHNEGNKHMSLRNTYQHRKEAIDTTNASGAVTGIHKNTKKKKKCKKSIISTSTATTTTETINSTTTTTADVAAMTSAIDISTNGNDDDHDIHTDEKSRNIAYRVQNLTSAGFESNENNSTPNATTSSMTYVQPVRISFVPLVGAESNDDNNNINDDDDDDDENCTSSAISIPPYMQQHSGKIDLILHKLTEDIAIVFNNNNNNNITTSTNTMKSNPDTTENERKNTKSQQRNIAVEQIRRLVEYNNHKLNQQKKQQPKLSISSASTPLSFILDHPYSVKKVMCRADIATTLELCLQHCTTTSGIPVRTPKYYIYSNHHIQDDYAIQRAEIQALQQQLSFPIIVKPLVAAGTKASHAMTIVMKTDRNPDNNEIDQQQQLHSILRNKVPCLCQEYYNHDAKLYKVYVLGNFVSVHVRRSLPNLPDPYDSSSSTTRCTNDTNYYKYVEFDSQRPYPTLSDFGYRDFPTTITDACTDTLHNGTNVTVDSDINCHDDCITVDEVKPIVSALKKAFQLELFGFDILMTTTTSTTSSNGPTTKTMYNHRHDKMIYVVDVNYFPSYKEVNNFPTLLAQYLAQRVLSNQFSHQ